MTIEQKVELVDANREQFGLNQCCLALDLHKSTYYNRQKMKARESRDKALVKHLKAIIANGHAAYGYRPLLVELKEEYNVIVNHKRLRRVLRDYQMSLPRCVASHTPSRVKRILNENKGEVNLIEGRKEFQPLEVLSTDFTELKYKGGKAWLMALIDVRTKWVCGWALADSRGRKMALECWAMAEESLLEYRGDLKDLIVHHDQDSVYTSYDWLKQLLVKSEVHVSFSERGARDNPWIESFWSRTKSDWHSRITEAESLKELQMVMAEWFEYYNTRRRHSSIDYQFPYDVMIAETRGRMTGDLSQN